MCNNLSTIVLERCLNISENSQLRVRYKVNKSIKPISALVDYKQSLFFLSPSSETRETRK